MLATAQSIVRGCAITSGNGFLFGSHAAFRRLPGTDYGMKLYWSVGDRNDNFSMQELAAFYGLAPKVVSKSAFEGVCTNKKKVWGFLTEAIPETEKERFYGRSVNAYHNSDYALWWSQNRKVVHGLCREVERIGLTGRISDTFGGSWLRLIFLARTS
jgi:hypothetical protein